MPKVLIHGLGGRMFAGFRKVRQIILNLVVLASLISADAEVARSDFLNYTVGNSLSWDLLLADGYDSTTLQQSDPTHSGFHIRCNSSLTNTLLDPNNVCVPVNDLGTFQQGLSGRLDTAFFQPFYGSTIRQEIDSMKTFIDYMRVNPANVNTRAFLYATWSENKTDAPFLTTWNQHHATLEGTFIPSRSTYELMMTTLHQEGYAVELIPAGHVMASITEAMNNGLIVEGLTTPDELYRDGIHASNAGKYVAAVSAFSAVYNEDPTGQTMSTYAFGLPGYGPALVGDGIIQVQSIAWQTQLNLTAVPEPSSLALLALTLASAGVAALRMRLRV